MRNYGGSHKRFASPLRRDLRVVVCLFPTQVFRCARLNASGILGLQGDELIGRLTNVFLECKGKDSIRLVWGHQGWVDSFSGIPLKGNRIKVVASRPTAERMRHLWKPSRDQRTRELNAAHILTAFWKLNGSRILETMKQHRRYFLTAFWRLNGSRILEEVKEQHRRYCAAHILTAFWKLNGSRILEKMRQQRMYSAAHILTAFWKLNGSRILDKMKERRRYLAPRYKYPKNCCLLVDMGEDRNWMY